MVESETQARRPHQEIYGFVLYLGSFIVFAAYLIWAYVPDHVLLRLGIAYYPDK
jgi:phosphatidylinositol glycan class P protein